MDHPFKSPVILSYCTGFRGLERGIERAIGSTRTAVYVEIEAFIIENLLVGMEKGVLDAAPIWPNIKTFDARPFRDRIHGIIGGYPCQPFSMAGNRKGTDDPRHLWPYLERDIRAVRPLWCFFENVSGHLSLGFSEVRQSLSYMGYAVEAGIFTAEEVGAPHRRERLFILAIQTNVLDYPNCATNRNEQGGFYTETARTSKKLAYTNSQRPSHSKFEINPTERGEYAQRDFAAGDKNELANACNIGCKHRRNNWQKRHIQRNIGFAKENKPEWKRWERGACKACTNMARRKERKLEHSCSQGFQNSKHNRAFDQRKRQQEPLRPIEQSSNAQNVANPNSSGGRQDTQPSQLWPSSFEQPPINSRIAHQRENNQSRLDRWPARPEEEQHDWEQPRTVKPGVGSTIDGYNFREDLLRAYGNSVVEQSAELAMISLLKKFGF